MTTRLVVANTAFGLATVCAAYEAGLLAVDGPQVLVVVTNTPDPRATVRLTEVAGARHLVRRFDAVQDLNRAVRPHHPRRWRPATADLRPWERRLRERWEIGGDDVTLLTESVAGEPAQSLARVFAGAPLEVYADGLMSYGPTGGPVAGGVAERVGRLLYLDLVPGLRPALHREWGVPSVAVPVAALRSVVASGLDARRTGERPRAAVVLGQYLASDGLLAEREELDLYADLVRRCAGAGHARVVFKQHPSAPAGQGEALRRRLDAVPGFAVSTRPALVEGWFAQGSVDLAVGCFSTALLTAATAYGIPVGRLGTGDVLARMRHGPDLNRVPALLVDATVPDLDADGPGRLRLPDGLQRLVDEAPGHPAGRSAPVGARVER